MLITFQTWTWFPLFLIHWEIWSRFDRETDKERTALCCASVFNIYSLQISPSNSQQYIWFEGYRNDRSVHWKTWATNIGLGTDRPDCNEAPRGPVRPETKDPIGVLHTRRGEVPILLSSPYGFDTLSGSVLLLATDQYALFYSFLVSLSQSPWGNVKKWQSSIKQLWPPHQLPGAATKRLFLCELRLPVRSGDWGPLNQWGMILGMKHDYGVRNMYILRRIQLCLNLAITSRQLQISM